MVDPAVPPVVQRPPHAGVGAAAVAGAARGANRPLAVAGAAGAAAAVDGPPTAMVAAAPPAEAPAPVRQATGVAVAAAAAGRAAGAAAGRPPSGAEKVVARVHAAAKGPWLPLGPARAERMVRVASAQPFVTLGLGTCRPVPTALAVARAAPLAARVPGVAAAPFPLANHPTFAPTAFKMVASIGNGATVSWVAVFGVGAVSTAA